MTDPRLAAAIEIEREANALLRLVDALVADSTRMKRKAQRLRDEIAAERELDQIREHVGSSVRARRGRKAA